MAIRLGRPLPDASRDLPGRRRGNPPAGNSEESRPVAPIRSCSRWGLPCRPRCRGRGALLPHPFTLAGRAEAVPAVCFLWHFPWGRPRRPLTGTVLPWSPDFPPPAGFPRCEGQPSSRLARVLYRGSGPWAQPEIRYWRFPVARPGWRGVRLPSRAVGRDAAGPAPSNPCALPPVAANLRRTRTIN